MQCSIQRAAAWVLDQYYSDFPVYNPALLNLPKSILTKKMSAFKVYNLGEGNNSAEEKNLISPSEINDAEWKSSFHLHM